jgi:hypothetical protein
VACGLQKNVTLGVYANLSTDTNCTPLIIIFSFIYIQLNLRLFFLKNMNVTVVGWKEYSRRASKKLHMTRPNMIYGSLKQKKLRIGSFPSLQAVCSKQGDLPNFIFNLLNVLF